MSLCAQWHAKHGVELRMLHMCVCVSCFESKTNKKGKSQFEVPKRRESHVYPLPTQILMLMTERLDCTCCAMLGLWRVEQDFGLSLSMACRNLIHFPEVDFVSTPSPGTCRLPKKLGELFRFLHVCVCG